MEKLEEEKVSYDFILQEYEKKLKHLFQKLNDKCSEKPLSKQEIFLEEFIMIGIDRSKVASMIYGIHRNKSKGIGFTDGKPNEVNLKSCLDYIKEGLKAYLCQKLIKRKF